MVGVVSGPANLYDSSGHGLISLPVASSLGGNSSYVLAVAVIDQFGNQIVNFASSGSSSPLGTVAVSSGTITLSSGPIVTISSGTVTLSSAPSVTVASALSSVGTPTSITASSSSQVILSSDAARLGGTIFNQSGETLYIMLASTATMASTASFTLGMVGMSYFEIPFAYTGTITGLWSPSSGAARITAFS